jgi:serine protease inhibitor
MDRFENALEMKSLPISSPLSIRCLMSLIFLLCGDKTKIELGELFFIKESEEQLFKALINIKYNFKKMNVNVVDGFFINEKIGIKNSGKVFLRKIAVVTRCDFEDNGILDMINEEMKDYTMDFVPKTTRGMVINTINFKKIWKYPFKEKYTKDVGFTKLNNQTVKIPTMRQSNRYNHYSDDDFEFMEIPFHDVYSMLIFIPKLKKYFNNVSGLIDVFDYLKRSENKEVCVSLPKFRVRKSFNLKPFLLSLGIRSLFLPDANLNKVSEGLYITKIDHEAIFEIDEEGVKQDPKKHVPPVVSPIDFKADRTFKYFVINRNTKMILLSGVFDG